MKIDLIIKNCYIYDGTGNKPFCGDIGIFGDKICFLRREDSKNFEAESKEIIDVKGMVVTPGFIDVHSHSDFTILADNRIEGKVCQGITTEINGNCGLSAAPLIGEVIEHREKDLQEFEIKDRWRSFREYFHILEKQGLYINYATLVGHGNIRGAVIGYKNKQPNKSELSKMKELLKNSIDDGAIGLSTGLIYQPGIFSTTGEIIELTKTINNLIYTSHIRSEGDRLLESIEEVIYIGTSANIHVHISHIKSSWRRNWWKIDEVIKMIDLARSSGLKITCDRYPYIASSTDLDVLLPVELYEIDLSKEVERLRDDDVKELIKDELIRKHGDYNFLNNVIISSVSNDKNRWMEGRSISEIASIENVEPFDELIKILISEKLKVSAIFFSMDEDNMIKILKLPYSFVGTDSSGRSFSGTTCKGKPHPRGFGTFPRFLGRYVRDRSLIDLSEAIHKITFLPAKNFGLYERGIIREGAYADIVVFDYEKIIDNSSFEQPFLKPSGIHHVIVNGKIVLYNGELTGKKPGRILRQGRSF